MVLKSWSFSIKTELFFLQRSVFFTHLNIRTLYFFFAPMHKKNNEPLLHDVFSFKAQISFSLTDSQPSRVCDRSANRRRLHAWCQSLIRSQSRWIIPHNLLTDHLPLMDNQWAGRRAERLYKSRETRGGQERAAAAGNETTTRQMYEGERPARKEERATKRGRSGRWEVWGMCGWQRGNERCCWWMNYEWCHIQKYKTPG